MESSGAVELRRIRGPSAFGGTWARFRDLVWIEALTEFRSRYLESVLGYLWTLLRPLLLFGVLLVVLREILGFGGDIPEYPAILLLNVLLFTFFVEATGYAVRSVRIKEAIVRKTQFPRIVIPLSVVLTAALTLLMNFIGVGIFFILYGAEPLWTWLLFPALLAMLIAFTTGVSTILSALFVRFRDIDQIWAIISRLLFYASPVLYPVDQVPEGTLRTIVGLNPLAPLLTQARVWFIDPAAPSATEALGLGVVLGAAAIGVGLCAFSVWLFNREAPLMAERI